MIILQVLTVLAVSTVLILLLVWAVLSEANALETDRYERLRIEYETLKAERQVFDLTSQAAQRMLDAARQERLNRP